MKNTRTGPRICVCGSARNVELHHVGGKNHVVWFLVPLCREHHFQLTLMLQRAGVDMRYTPDKCERMRRTRLATYVFLWFIDGVLNEQETKRRE
jgi:hypothetical protein